MWLMRSGVALDGRGPTGFGLVLGIDDSGVFGALVSSRQHDDTSPTVDPRRRRCWWC